MMRSDAFGEYVSKGFNLSLETPNLCLDKFQIFLGLPVECSRKGLCYENVMCLALLWLGSNNAIQHKHDTLSDL